MNRHPHRRIVTMQVPIIGHAIVHFEVVDDEVNIDHQYVQPIAEAAIETMASVSRDSSSAFLHNVYVDELVVDTDRAIEIEAVDSP